MAFVSPYASADDAATVLARSRSAYAALESYQDTGAVKVGGEAERTFATAFVRPDHFRFEWAVPQPFLLPFATRTRYAIYSDGVSSHLWLNIDSGKDDVESSLAAAVAGGASLSRGAAPHIATLLIPDLRKSDPSGSSVLALADANEVGVEPVDGIACDHLAGTTADADGPRPTQLWIGQQDHLVRRIVTQTGAAKTITETHRDIRIGDAIPPNLFTTARRP
jgi:outer membrane lipoprotein-sorting protein